MTQEEEQQLVARAKKDPQAFAMLYDRYVDRIYAYIYRYTNDMAQAQDVTAVTFEKALTHLRSYRWQGKSFCAWLYRIARNELIQQQRKQRWTVPLKAWLQLGTNGRQPETAVQRSEQHNNLHQALDQLSAKDREIVSLRFFEELSSTEVAEVLNCSTQTVYVRLHRALQRLRQQIEDIEQLAEVINHVSE